MKQSQRNALKKSSILRIILPTLEGSLSLVGTFILQCDSSSRSSDKPQVLGFTERGYGRCNATGTDDLPKPNYE